ncbi:MAG: hypothetical protein KAW17_03770 [Candidatus Eisenbacteria sp.]|nr:hypothetical protein [Candidatus Eisenbacteria bacterium]
MTSGPVDKDRARKVRCSSGRSTGPRKPAVLKLRTRKRGQKKHPPAVTQAFIMARARFPTPVSLAGTLRLLQEQFGCRAPRSLTTLKSWDADFDCEIRDLRRKLHELTAEILVENEKERLQTLGRAANKILQLIEGAEGQIEAKDLPKFIQCLMDLVEQARLEQKSTVGSESAGGQVGGGDSFLDGIVDLAKIAETNPEGAENIRNLLQGVGDSIVARHPEIASRLG